MGYIYGMSRETPGARKARYERDKAARHAAKAARQLAALPEITPSMRALAEVIPPVREIAHLREYNPLVCANIIERVANGETLRGICKQDGMPDRTSFQSWVVAYPDLRSAWEAARRVKAHTLFDEALDAARDLKERAGDVGAAEVNALRVAIDTLKWTAGKLNPQEYGDKSITTPAIAIQINCGLDLGGQGLTTPTASTIYNIKAVPVFEDEQAAGPEPSRVPGPSASIRQRRLRPPIRTEDPSGQEEAYIDPA